MFVVEQNNVAKAVTGAVFLAMVEAHGGIASITQTSDYKLTFTFADGTTWTTPNAVKGDSGDTGVGISSVNKTSTSGLIDTYTITMTNGTTATFTVTNGADGSAGAITSTTYGTTSSSEIQPSSWQSTIPTVASGNYLWTRYLWNNGNYTYLCTRYGTDGGSGSGDMTKAVYDSDNAVATAGGIADYVESQIDSTPTSGSTKAAQSGGVYTALQGKQAEHSTQTATLAVASWSSLSQTVSVTGVTASNTVIVSPAPASTSVWATAGIYCSAQASGTLTFTCTTTPTSAVSVNVVILD